MTGYLGTIQPDLMLWFGGSQVIYVVGSSLFSPTQTTASSGIETKQTDIYLGFVILIILVEAIACCLQPMVQSVHGSLELPQEPLFRIAKRAKFLWS